MCVCAHVRAYVSVCVRVCVCVRVDAFAANQARAHRQSSAVLLCERRLGLGRLRRRGRLRSAPPLAPTRACVRARYCACARACVRPWVRVYVDARVHACVSACIRVCASACQTCMCGVHACVRVSCVCVCDRRACVSRARALAPLAASDFGGGSRGRHGAGRRPLGLVCGATLGDDGKPSDAARSAARSARSARARRGDVGVPTIAVPHTSWAVSVCVCV